MESLSGQARTSKQPHWCSSQPPMCDCEVALLMPIAAARAWRLSCAQSAHCVVSRTESESPTPYQSQIYRMNVYFWCSCSKKGGRDVRIPRSSLEQLGIYSCEEQVPWTRRKARWTPTVILLFLQVCLHMCTCECTWVHTHRFCTAALDGGDN